MVIVIETSLYDDLQKRKLPQREKRVVVIDDAERTACPV
jgi:hypothetical protein